MHAACMLPDVSAAGADMYTTGQYFGSHHQPKGQLRSYAADDRSGGASEKCTKHAYRSGKLTPGAYLLLSRLMYSG